MSLMHLTTCYGRDIEALADLGGDVDVMSADDLAAWNLRHWTEIAAAIGFSKGLADAAQSLRKTRLGLVGIHSAALTAFEQWHSALPRTLSPALPPVVRHARAKVRHEAMLALGGPAYTAMLWKPEVPAHRLPSQACFERGPATQVSGRAFLVDAMAGYFHPTRAGAVGMKSPCGWESPVLLSLGTFPWVYGSRLGPEPPALAWDPSAPYNAAALAMRLSARLWQPIGNLQQDARLVVQHYRHFRAAAEYAFAQIPAWSKDQAVPGQLYRQGLLLVAEQSSLEMHGGNAAIGYLAASTHNYIVRRFAAFFALRRALVRAYAKLPPEQKEAIERNPDPCLRQAAPKPLGNLELRP